MEEAGVGRKENYQKKLKQMKKALHHEGPETPPENIVTKFEAIDEFHH
jgi:hypothetical protein